MSTPGITRLDGRERRMPTRLTTDVVVVGSGPAGAAVAATVAAAGARCIVVEEGRWWQPAELHEDTLSAMADYYRDFGATVAMGPAPMPIVQGRAVGGTSLVNGAICWRLPRDVFDEWLTDPGLADAWDWPLIESLMDRVEQRLHIAPTDPAVAGPNNLLLGRGAEALGLEHRPINRNVVGCVGLGRCLQGCPEGHKLSMDHSYLLDAEAAGATILSSTTVQGVRLGDRAGGRRAVGVTARTAAGTTITVDARRAVVLAASAVHTPALLLRSGLADGPVGRHFMCHPGVSVAGRFAEPVRMWTGATQGHEVTGLRREGLKFEALGFGKAMVAARLPGAGSALAAEVAGIDHWANWGAAVRATGEGRVTVGRGGRAARPTVRFGLSALDVRRFRRGTAVLAHMMLAAGAESVRLGVHGWTQPVTDAAEVDRFAANGPLAARAYSTAATHLFGTARMGTDPATSVVRADLRHHSVEGLYVADSSVFPSNTGVNPQTSIIAVALRCGEHVIA